MIITPSNINRDKAGKIDLRVYGETELKAIDEAWSFKKEAKLELDLWSGKSNLKHGSILGLDMLKPNDDYLNLDFVKPTRFGWAYVYNEEDRHLNWKKIHATNKGIYINLGGRIYIDLPDIVLEEF